IDPREAERGHEATVRDAGVASRRVDPGDPEGAELTLPRAAIPVRVAKRVHRRLAGRPYELVLGGATAFGLGEELLVLLARGDTTLHACHGLHPSLQVRQQFGTSFRSPFATSAFPAWRRLREGDLCWFRWPLYAFARARRPRPVNS